jgi:hypothetical protein
MNIIGNIGLIIGCAALGIGVLVQLIAIQLHLNRICQILEANEKARKAERLAEPGAAPDGGGV